VLQVQPTTDLGKGSGTVRVAVISHDALNLYAVTFEEAQGVYQEARGDVRQLVRMDLHVSQAAGVIDAHVQVVPAGTLTAMVAIARDAMSQALESAELFGIDVDKFSGSLALVAQRWRWWVERGQLAHAQSAQMLGNRRARQPQALGNSLSGEALQA
jgi:hypothetical protein